MASNGSIKNWAADDRPREKVLDKGLAALTDVELLTILIANGTKDKSALDLAKEVYALAGNNLVTLAGLQPLDIVKQIKGIGKAKAISICAALEIGRRRQHAQVAVVPYLKTVHEVVAFLKPLLQDKDTEQTYVVYLNNSLKVMHHGVISTGGLDTSIMDGRQIFHKALELKAKRIIIAHNHPSGNAKPSQQDVLITNKLKESGAILGIPLLDHVIITQTSCYSFTEDAFVN